MKPEHMKLLRDRFWRLNNLYFITDKQGKKVRFRMTQEQIDYFQGMHTRNIILKARQLGFDVLPVIPPPDIVCSFSPLTGRAHYFQVPLELADIWTFVHAFGSVKSILILWRYSAWL